MDSSRISKEEIEFNTLMNNLRNEKTLISLENIIEYIKSNIEKFTQNKILSYKLLDELFFFLQNNNISKQTQIDFYKYFIDLFISMKFKPEDLLKLDFLSNIFSQKSNFYTQSTSINSLNSLLEKYYNFFFPIEEEKKEFGKNDIIDYLNEEDNYYNWTQGEIISINNNQVQIKLLDNKKNKTELNEINKEDQDIIIPRIYNYQYVELKGNKNLTSKNKKRVNKNNYFSVQNLTLDNYNFEKNKIKILNDYEMRFKILTMHNKLFKV